MNNEDEIGCTWIIGEGLKEIGLTEKKRWLMVSPLGEGLKNTSTVRLPVIKD